MNIHYLLLLVIMAITFFMYGMNESERNKKVCIIIVTIILTLFTGLRSPWMGDLGKYYSNYVASSSSGWEIHVFGGLTNIGIRLLFRIVSYLGGDYQICLFLISFLVALSLGIIVYKYSPSPYWSYLIYISMGFYIFTYSGLKQAIAMSFLLLAGIGIFESNFKKFMFWLIIAGLFHAPAFIFLPSYLFAGFKTDYKYFMLVFLLIILVCFFQTQILSILTDAYYEDEIQYVAKKTIGGRVLMMIIILCVSWFLRPPREGDEIYCKVFNLMVLAAIIQYFSIYGNIFTRLADYYYQFVILLIPLIMEPAEHRLRIDPNPRYMVRVHQNYIYVFMTLAISAFALWFYYPQVYQSSFVLSYRFIWQLN